jgi:hypothetical protein
VTTYPYVYDHPDNIPVQASCLERRFGRQLAKVINPDIPLSGRFSMFDEIGWAQALAPATPQPRHHIWTTARSIQDQLATAAALASTTRHHRSDEPDRSLANEGLAG